MKRLNPHVNELTFILKSNGETIVDYGLIKNIGPDKLKEQEQWEEKYREYLSQHDYCLGDD